MKIPRNAQTVIVRSPLRISFVGGGSDLPGGVGRTVSTAIDKYVWAIVRRRRDDRVIMHWREHEEVDSAYELRHEIAKWILVREGMLNGVEIVTLADVPGVGSGLGSSAATTCAILSGVTALKGWALQGKDLAESAAEIELDYLRRVAGKQDQYATALGGVLSIRWQPDGGVDVNDLRMTDADRLRLAENFALFSQREGVGRSSNDVLSKNSLSGEWREDCCALCAKFVEALESHDFEEMGSLVAKHHAMKCDGFEDYRPSELDAISGSITQPFKLCGAGASGHLLVHTDPRDRHWIVKEVEELWGPQLPWQPVGRGTEILHVE